MLDQVCKHICLDCDFELIVLQVAGNLLLHSKEPLFKRYISMSGTTLMMQPLPPQVPEFVYSTILKSLDAEELSSNERIKKLLSLSDTEVATLAPPSLPLLPVVDHDLIPGNVNFAQISSKQGPPISIPGRHWCEELLIGDCQFDVSSPLSITGEVCTE